MLNMRNFGKSGGFFCKIRKKSDSKFENPEKFTKDFHVKKKLHGNPLKNVKSEVIKKVSLISLKIGSVIVHNI